MSHPLYHLAIIMDGNGRWAAARKMPRAVGHRQGAEALRAIIPVCKEEGIRYLTLYAFSSENWDRPEEEVSALMELLAYYLEREIESLHRQGVCIRVIGEVERLNPVIARQIQAAETLTTHNKELTVIVALSYGARQEMVRAARLLAEQVAAGTITPDAIDDAALTTMLYAPDIPDPDLLIRTGGEQRISNFLLWQIAYTELLFTDILWPDFTPAHLREAVEAFKMRERRFGRTQPDQAIAEQVPVKDETSSSIAHAHGHG